MGCKDICLRYKVNKPATGGRYSAGQKKCQKCHIFMMWDGIFCPCCNYRLRLSSRGKKSKLKAEIIRPIHRY